MLCNQDEIKHSRQSKRETSVSRRQRRHARMDKTEEFERRGPRAPGFWGKWRGVTCAFDGCGAPARARGYCNSHYNKVRWANGERSPSANSKSRRAAHLRHRYGIDLHEYDALLLKQDGRCAICRQPPTTNVRAHWGGKLCVDHDHVKGTARGLLCNDCNLAVGYAKTADILFKAAQYLLNHS